MHVDWYLQQMLKINAKSTNGKMSYRETENLANSFNLLQHHQWPEAGETAEIVAELLASKTGV